MHAYVLIGLREAHEKSVLDGFLDFDEVEDGHILFGEWDLILKIKGDTAEDVATFVMDHVRNHEDVRLSSTLIVAK
ncbi:Lrp/AsnC ligand binding domain-containing protein [Candidatus Woesearchaeota archaeon]|nr:Lrp/AsnC ligand binding domain-containing protein [Candidatus Woesearchaeota archaeon]MCF7901268.1 Lrp/AsnC ligand binding domain-containing protein [Candidatus Woesearchaeota archaeon]MCF8013565.1 Lrp/AsnC ligand binding domain-containing protein [Candidatus Woesearchaeota archaeon]